MLSRTVLCNKTVRPDGARPLAGARSTDQRQVIEPVTRLGADLALIRGATAMRDAHLPSTMGQQFEPGVASAELQQRTGHGREDRAHLSSFAVAIMVQRLSAL